MLTHSSGGFPLFSSSAIVVHDPGPAAMRLRRRYPMTVSIGQDYCPNLGQRKTHIWGGVIVTIPPMGASARLILAANLTRLMAESEDLKTIKQLHDATVRHGVGVSTGTIDRIRRAKVSAGVDHLTALAQAFGLEPWQLLEAGVKAPSSAVLAKAQIIENMDLKQRGRLDQAIALAMDIDLTELVRRERDPDTAFGDVPDEPTGTK